MKKILFAFGLFILGSASVFADSANVGGKGNTVTMLNNEDVQMVSEVINLTVGSESKTSEIYGEIYGGHVDVDVSYVFKNLSNKAVTVQMGFPEECGGSCYIDDPEFKSDNIGTYENYKLLDFKAYDDDKDYSITFKKDDDSSLDKNWYTYEVKFAPGEEKKITNSYWIVPFSYKSGVRWFDYILETGASWKGVIESVDVFLNFDDVMTPYDILELSPSDYKYTRGLLGHISWHFDNLEPGFDSNIHAIYRDPDGGDFGCEMASEFGADSQGSASSYLPADSEYYYFPCKGYDHNNSTAWVEGVDGDGKGQWLEIPVPSGENLSVMRISNGYASNEDTWAKNNRVKKAKLTFSNGITQTIELDDFFGYQFVYLDTPFFVSYDDENVTAKLEILEVYPGSKFNDTALSEVQILGSLGYSFFPDVVDHPYEDAIGFVKVRGIVKGYDDGTYKPNKTVNRAEMMKIIIEAEYPGEASGSNCFSDVKDEWFAKYICFAKDKGIVSGYEDGSFKPDQAVNYVEALKMTLETMDGYFEEVEGPWYQKYLNRADDLAASVANTKNDEPFSRGKMAQLIKNVLMAD